jgi:IclR family transcriptional regulator, acetate operon repressor
MVTSVVQAVAVLRHLAAIDRGRGVTAVAAAIGISPSSCFNVLKTLVAEDLVAFDDETKTYSVGLGAIDLGYSATRRNAVIKAAESRMIKLAKEHDGAVGLWRVSNRERLTLVHLAESLGSTRIHLSIGQRLPLGAGAMGRCVAAVQDPGEAELSRRFAAVRWEQAPKFDAYAAQIETARRQGFSTDVDQLLRGISSVAASVLDRWGDVRFCLSVTMFSGRHSAEKMRRIGKDVRNNADEISIAGFGTIRG